MSLLPLSSQQAAEVKDELIVSHFGDRLETPIVAKTLHFSYFHRFVFLFFLPLQQIEQQFLNFGL